MILRKLSERVVYLQKCILDLILPPLVNGSCLAVDLVDSSSIPSTREADFSDSHILWMAVPKRNKSARMKRFERNRPWKIPKDFPYTTCNDCGSPRRVYFMCEVCYSKIKQATDTRQKSTYKELEKMKSEKKWEKTHLMYKPATYEEKMQPYLEKYTLERLKPQPIEPIDEPWKSAISEYKKWYLEDGDPVVKPKSDEDIELVDSENETVRDSENEDLSANNKTDL